MIARALISIVAVVSSLAQADVVVTNAWSRATPPSTTVGVVYADLLAKQSDELLAVESALAERAELHESSNASGTMKMRQLHSVPLPASVRVGLRPGGTHVMLIGLRKALVAGETVSLVLRFRTSSPVMVQAKILGPSERLPQTEPG